MHIFNQIHKGIKKIIPSKEPTTQTNLNDTNDNNDKTKVFEVIRTQKPLILPPKAIISSLNNQHTIDIEICSARTNIGRIYSNEICIRDAQASRLHAFIVLESGSHVIYDAKSRNGTYVNKKRVEKHILKHGDIIKIGDVLLKYNRC